jgi:hypothetical protein
MRSQARGMATGIADEERRSQTKLGENLAIGCLPLLNEPVIERQCDGASVTGRKLVAGDVEHAIHPGPRFRFVAIRRNPARSSDGLGR